MINNDAKVVIGIGMIMVVLFLCASYAFGDYITLFKTSDSLYHRINSKILWQTGNTFFSDWFNYPKLYYYFFPDPVIVDYIFSLILVPLAILFFSKQILTNDRKIIPTLLYFATPVPYSMIGLHGQIISMFFIFVSMGYFLEKRYPFAFSCLLVSAIGHQGSLLFSVFLAMIYCFSIFKYNGMMAFFIFNPFSNMEFSALNLFGIPSYVYALLGISYIRGIMEKERMPHFEFFRVVTVCTFLAISLNVRAMFMLVPLLLIYLTWSFRGLDSKSVYSVSCLLIVIGSLGTIKGVVNYSTEIKNEYLLGLPFYLHDGKVCITNNSAYPIRESFYGFTAWVNGDYDVVLCSNKFVENMSANRIINTSLNSTIVRLCQLKYDMYSETGLMLNHTLCKEAILGQYGIG